ncbi:MAG: zinc dependent phospholipase C family protein [Oscillospiraceae bacterium]
MPSTYAHYRFGREVFSKLPKEIKKTISKEQDLFNIGLHGPDLLFYYHPLAANSVNSKGYGMHSEAGIKFFRCAAEEIMFRRFSPAYLAYAYGVICHFALDRECHGYIDEKIAESGVSHAEIEVEFDRRLMINDGLNPITHTLTEHIIPDKRSARVISRFYNGVSPKCIYQSMQSYVFYNRLLLAPNMLKRNVIYGILKISGHYDDMHGLIVNYKANPKCRDSNKELALRYGKALNKAIMLISEFEESAKGVKPWNDLYNYTFGSEYKENCNEK